MTRPLRRSWELLHDGNETRYVSKNGAFEFHMNLLGITGPGGVVRKCPAPWSWVRIKENAISGFQSSRFQTLRLLRLRIKKA